MDTDIDCAKHHISPFQQLTEKTRLGIAIRFFLLLNCVASIRVTPVCRHGERQRKAEAALFRNTQGQACTQLLLLIQPNTTYSTG